MGRNIVFMNAGQGCQHFGMAKGLYDENEVFRSILDELNNYIRDMYGFSIYDYIFDPRNKKGSLCDEIRYTHPAIFIIEYALGKTLIEFGIEPDVLVGSSLGEMSSLALANVIKVEEGISSIMQQVNILETYGKQGAMIALLEPIEIFYQDKYIYENSRLGGINYEDNFIICVNKDKIIPMIEYLKKQKYTFSKLPVNYAFHSEYIDCLEEKFKDHFKTLQLNSPQIRVISSATTQEVHDANNKYLWEIFRKTISFSDTISNIERIDGEKVYIDLSPSSTLINFVKRSIGSNSLSQYYPILSIFNRDAINFKEVIKAVKN